MVKYNSTLLIKVLEKSKNRGEPFNSIGDINFYVIKKN